VRGGDNWKKNQATTLYSETNAKKSIGTIDRNGSREYYANLDVHAMYRVIWNSSFYRIHPFARMKEAQYDCLLLNCYTTFCFENGGSTLPFVSKETPFFFLKQSIMAHAVEESICPFILNHISNNLEANPQCSLEYICKRYKWFLFSFDGKKNNPGLLQEII
jgi:hypothetical protein